MNRLNILIWISQLTTWIIFCASFFSTKAWVPFSINVVLLFVFLAGWRWGWDWVPPVLLITASILAGYAAILGFNIFILLLALSTQLISWDLSRLKMRFIQFQRREKEGAIVRRHLSRLALLTGLSIILAIFPMLFDLKITFPLTILLGLVVISGLSLFFRKIRFFDQQP